MLLTERIRRGHRLTNLSRIHKRRQPAGVNGEALDRFTLLAAEAARFVTDRYPQRCTVPEVVGALRAGVSDIDEREAEGAV